MGITRNGIEEYKGLVVSTDEYFWMDGMVDELAYVWDMDKHEFKTIKTGYYGSDFQNLMEDAKVEVDLTEEARRDILRTIKHGEAVKAFVRSVKEKKALIGRGMNVEVIRGRKVKKGTKLEVFWTGYKLNQWTNDEELIAGCYDDEGNTVWVKAEYLKNLDPPKSPNAKERKRFIKDYVTSRARTMGVAV